MKKFLSITLLFSLLSSIIVPSVHAEAPKEDVIIVFKDGIDHRAVKDVNGEIEEVYNHVPIATGEIPKDAIDLLERDKDVLAVEVDQKVQVSGQIQDWGISTVDAPQAWESELTGKGIKIAVIDTGISPHEDLVVAGGASFVAYTTSYDDDNGHGQHVAGIIGAEKNNNIGTVGVAPDADVFAVKVLDKNGSGYLSDIIKGIDWSITNKMDIINLSLGAPNESLALKQAVDKAYSQGILVVAAAGNNGNPDGSGDTVNYPARYDSTIAVAAIDSVTNRESFSATGNTIEVAAPGVNILSTYLTNQYVRMNGTSMAAPFVSGTLALMKQAHPTLSNIQLREKLKENAIDLGAKGKDPFFGYGLIQVPMKAQEEVKTKTNEPQAQPVPAPTPSHEARKQVEPMPVKQPVKVGPKKAVNKPAPKKNLTTTVSTAKSTYVAGNTVWVTIKAVDKVSKKPIANGSVKLTIVAPKGKAKVVTLKTNSKGQASYKMITSKRTTKGSYKFSTTTSVSNYKTVYSSKTIRIK